MIRKKENKIRKAEQSILKYMMAKPTSKVDRILSRLNIKVMNLKKS